MPETRRGFLATCLGAALASAQDQPNTTIKAGVKVVNVFATVRDKKGQIIKTLTQSDFSIEEDARPQVIRYFTRESDLELTLGLLIDTSGSQRRVIGEERSASYRFFDQVLREDKDFVFVIRFDHEVELVVDLTSSRKRLEQGIYNLQASSVGGSGRSASGPRRGGGTALYDAVLLASEDVAARQHGRKALIVMSDGEDRGSKVSLNRAIDAAQKADTLVYSILFADQEPRSYPGSYGGRRRGGGGRMPPPPSRQSGPDGDGRKVLERLARETGGSFFTVSNKMPLGEIFERMQEELRNQYSLGYTPDTPAKPGEFRKIRVATRDKALIVQSRDGYYGTN